MTLVNICFLCTRPFLVFEIKTTSSLCARLLEHWADNRYKQVMQKKWTTEELFWAKKAAARKAVLQLRSFQVVGLGTGSTVEQMLPLIPALKLSGMRFVCTSQRTKRMAISLGLTVLDLDECITHSLDEKPIDMTIDGADEVDSEFRLMKGGGGALLWEKLIAQSSKVMCVIVSPEKRVKTLGQSFSLPVEVVFYGRNKVLQSIQALHKKAQIRKHDGLIVRTDSGNCLIDIPGLIENPEELHASLKQITGVVETGLFLNEASFVYIGQPDGSCLVTQKNQQKET